MTEVIPDDPNCLTGWTFDKEYWDQVDYAANHWGFYYVAYPDCNLSCVTNTIPPCDIVAPKLMVLYSKAACFQYTYNTSTGTSHLVPCENSEVCKQSWSVCCDGLEIRTTKLLTYGTSVLCGPPIIIDPFATSPCFASCY
ncbi:MAG: hypothetical protein JNJ85_06565 [Candidatus Kapabacteria bacterium]|nr:hypothetical protein [Candidatus Kapabacteria bacterium]